MTAHRPMKPQRILITGTLSPLALARFAQEDWIQVSYEPNLPQDLLLEKIPEYECLLTRSETPITAGLIARGSRLRVIARAAVGVANIDVVAATEKGILVINTPGMNTNSAAELTMGLLLAIQRKLMAAHGAMQRGEWGRHRFQGHELRGKTIGIIGLGNVGHRVARFARGFEMKVLACDPHISSERFEQHHATKVSLETLLEQSDIVSLHVPRTAETTGMIGADEIAHMKPGVIVLNAARGGILQEAALLEALRSGKVAGAGIDTWEVEPPVAHPFRTLSNVVMTPHIGATTVEAQNAVGLTVANQTIKALRGDIVDFPVNMPKMKVLEGSAAKKYTVLSERMGSFAAQCLDFVPTVLEVFYRGNLTEDDAALSTLAFVKGLLQHTSDELITYVNAERRAEARGLRLQHAVDHDYMDYENSIRFVLTHRRERFELAGLVFSEGHSRLTRVNEFLVEMEPTGHLLLTTNRDKPGMIGFIGTVLGQHNINIDQFELGRNRPGGEALALIRIDQEPSDAALTELVNRSGITSVKPIRL